MKIGRLLVIGFVGLSVLIVVVLNMFFRNELKTTTEIINTEMVTTVEFMQEKNQLMLDRIGQMGTETGDIATQMGEEQLRLVGQAVVNDIRSNLEMHLSDVRTAAEFMLSYRNIALQRNELPDRSVSDEMLWRFFEAKPEYYAVWSAWEAEAYDNHDEDYIDIDENKPDEYQNPTGRYSPWFLRGDCVENHGYISAEECEEEEFYLLPKRTKLEWVMEPYLDTTTSPPVTMTSLCVPFVDGEEFLGVLGIDISVAGLSEMIAPYRPFGSGYVMLVSPQGVITAHPDPEYLMKSLSEIPGAMRSMELVLSGKEGFYSDKAFGNDRNYLKYHIPFTIGDSPEKWSIIVLADFDQVMKARNKMLAATDEALSDIQNIGNELFRESERRSQQVTESNQMLVTRTLQKTLGIGGIVLLLACFIGVVFAAKVNALIRARDHWYRQILDAANSPFIVLDQKLEISFLNKKSLNLLNRRFSEILGKPVGKVWSPEVERVVRKVAERSGDKAAQQTLVNFESLTWQVHADVLLDEKGHRIGFVEFLQDVSDRENIFEMVDEIKRVVNVTQHETSEISSDASNLSNGAEQQQESLGTIVSMIDEMSNITSQNVSRAQDANHIAKDVVKAAAEGQKQMEQMVDSMKQISENAQNTQQVIKSIDDIAFQTNLLALNAAVEAARAGTHGKGFAVVAEEVRNLAARSAKAAHETEEMLKHSNQKIDDGVLIVNNTASSLNEIVELVSKTTDLISEIASSSDAQNKSVQQVDAGLKSVSSVTERNSSMASQTATSVLELNKAVNELSKLVNKMTTVDA